MPTRSSPLLLLGEKQKLLSFFLQPQVFRFLFVRDKNTKKVHTELNAK